MDFLNGIFWGLFIFLLLSCQTAEKRAETDLDSLAAKYSHLSAYREIQCSVRVKFAEPTKTAWLSKLFAVQHESAHGSNARVFQTLEEMRFHWRSTPYRCAITADRIDDSSAAVKQVLGDVTKQLDTVVCVWMQSFYADSPLRGWRKGEGVPLKLEDGVELQKGEGRSMTFTKSGHRVTGNFGSGQIISEYQERGGKLYPDEITFSKSGEVSRLADWVYETQSGREMPKSLWIKTPTGEGQSTASLQLNFDECRWN